jgi:hypothetical protein
LLYLSKSGPYSKTLDQDVKAFRELKVFARSRMTRSLVENRPTFESSLNISSAQKYPLLKPEDIYNRTCLETAYLG